MVLLVVDPEQELTQLPEILAGMFGLTKKEAVVAAKLAEGKSIEKLADDCERIALRLQRIGGA
jgi:hypothetical protein